MSFLVLLLGCGAGGIGGVLGLVGDAEDDASGKVPFVMAESVVCLTTVTDSLSTDPAIVAIGMDSGAMIPLQMASMRYSVHNHSIARVGKHLYNCKSGTLTQHDLTTGAVRESSVPCTAVTEIGGELLTTHRETAANRDEASDTIYWVGTWQDARAGTLELEAVAQARAPTIGRIDGRLIATREDDALDIRGEVGFDFERTLLDGRDGRIRGVSGAAGRLFVTDGRGAALIEEYDVDGTFVRDWHFPQGGLFDGLACSGPLDPSTFEDEFPRIGSGDPL